MQIQVVSAIRSREIVSKLDLTNERRYDHHQSLLDKSWQNVAQALSPSCRHEDKYILPCSDMQQSSIEDMCTRAKWFSVASQDRNPI